MKEEYKDLIIKPYLKDLAPQTTIEALELIKSKLSVFDDSINYLEIEMNGVLRKDICDEIISLYKEAGWEDVIIKDYKELRRNGTACGYITQLGFCKINLK